MKIRTGSHTDLRTESGWRSRVRLPTNKRTNGRTKNLGNGGIFTHPPLRAHARTGFLALAAVDVPRALASRRASSTTPTAAREIA